MGARDVPGAARASAVALGGPRHRAHNGRMAAHAQIIVGTPDHDLAGLVFLPFGAPQGDGKAARVALKVRKDPIAPLALQAFDRLMENGFVIHIRFPCRTASCGGLSFLPNLRQDVIT